MRKMVNVTPADLAALELLAGDHSKSLQDLFDEAIGDLLKKHGRPTTTKEMFERSLRKRRAANRT